MTPLKMCQGSQVKVVLIINCTTIYKIFNAIYQVGSLVFVNQFDECFMCEDTNLSTLCNGNCLRVLVADKTLKESLFRLIW
jgi:hypothetical protein